ncbi:MAG TPA: GxxExxY protein [Vicinamibacterales bacterium]|nr:GxxExxY protein [Vicinamibacterales bacterium]
MTLHTTPLAQAVIGLAIDIHRTLGPGLLESVYDQCLAYELSVHGHPFIQQLGIPVTYKGVRFECGYRADFVVGDQLLLEIKSVDQLTRLHTAQMITYLRLAGLKEGLLINFNAPRVIDGLRSLLL